MNVYQEVNRIMLAAPRPGTEPDNIRVEIDGHRVSLSGSLRGPGQTRTQQFIQREWSVGPYDRIIDLPVAVDGARANASFDNGVLVVILPIAERPTAGILILTKIGTAKGQLIQHVGLVPRPRCFVTLLNDAGCRTDGRYSRIELHAACYHRGR
ncbi:MAG: Hsp20/alpha crystallin family protein [bacterium]